MTFIFPWKQCKKCDEWKVVEEFPKGQLRCKSCTAVYMKEWSDKNRDRVNRNQLVYHTTTHGRASTLFNAAKKRARLSKEPFLLDFHFVLENVNRGFCQRTGLKFDLSLQPSKERLRFMNPLSPSIDKINHSGIYEPSNVQFVCTWYNLAKMQLSDEEMINFCKHVARVYQ